MFCEIHGCLLDFRGCPECALEEADSIRAENRCSECGSSDFKGAKDGLLSCSDCKLEHERVPNQDGFVRKAYTSVYQLFRRNSYHPYFWAKERLSGEIIYVIEVHEKPSGIRNWALSDGIFIAKFDHRGREVPIYRIGSGGMKYRPYVSGNWSDTGVDRSPLPKNFGFMFGEVFDEDWRIIEEPFKAPKIDSIVRDLVDRAFYQYHNRGKQMATEKQKRFLASKKLGYTGDVDKLTMGQAGKLITRLSKRR